MAVIPGLFGRAEEIVTEDKTAIAVGSGSLPVYGTPCMIALIEKGIALEFNSAELDTDGLFAPDPWVVKRYLELGGKKITLASDAHFLHEAGRGMEKAVSVLKEFGVQQLYFLKKREFHTYEI